ncbi:MAG: ATP-binding protein [Persicimonas sp.]
MSRLSTWKTESRRYLRAAVGVVHARLAAGLAGGEDQGVPGEDLASVEEAEAALAELAAELRDRREQPPALEVLAERFGLSGFERDVLVICAGVEFVPEFADWMRRFTGRGDGLATFGVAMSGLAGSSWDALTPEAALRRWRLITIEGDGASPASGPLTSRPISIDERILHFLAGVDQLDRRLEAIVEPVDVPAEFTETHRAVAESAARCFQSGFDSAAARRDLPVAQLFGISASARLDVAAASAAMIGCQLYMLDATDLPEAADDQAQLAVLWQREAFLSSHALAISVDDSGAGAGRGSSQKLARFLRRLAAPVFVVGREATSLGGVSTQRFEVARPPVDERRALWRASLGPLADRLGDGLDQLLSQFDLEPASIRAAAEQVRREAVGNGAAGALADALWTACVQQGRPKLEELTHRIEAKAGWHDLVLPDAHKDVLRTIAAHVRGRMQVYQDWGFAEQSSRGLGIAAIFSGESGTGKTMAAEVIAGELDLDLYRIDLSSVVSKYIGETEKNLRRIFDAAEGVGAILLFDEADALFGKRSEVKDSRDRYANLEVSYLLQRMEAYRGLAILTTNLADSIDSAFSRRVRFILEFPFPDCEQRAEIWRRVFPEQTPTEGLDVDKLAGLNVTGGNIRNIALNAAFLAADADQPVGMDHVICAARAEYAKLGKRLSDAELRAGR